MKHGRKAAICAAVETLPRAPLRHFGDIVPAKEPHFGKFFFLYSPVRPGWAKRMYM